MNWQVLITLQMSLVAFATIITRFLARDRKLANAGLAITAGWMAVLYVFGLIALIQIRGIDFGAFGEFGWRFMIGGTAFSLYNILFYYMLVYLDASIGTILGTVSAVFTVFGASLFLHENLTSLQIAGTGLLLISVAYGMLATRHKKSRSVHVSLAIGTIFALGSAFFYSIAAINEKYLLGHISVGTYILFGWGWQAIMAISAAVLIQPKTLKVLLKPNIAGWSLSLGIIRAISGLCFIYSLVKSNNVGLVTVVSNFRLIIIILLGAWLLKERNKMPQKLIAGFGACIALGLLFWR